MSEESDLEKTEPASPRRLEKAREEGQVARSRELSTLILLGAAVAGIWSGADSLGTTLQQALRRGLHFERASGFDTSFMLVQVGDMLLEGLLAALPILLSLIHI